MICLAVCRVGWNGKKPAEPYKWSGRASVHLKLKLTYKLKIVDLPGLEPGTF